MNHSFRLLGLVALLAMVVPRSAAVAQRAPRLAVHEQVIVRGEVLRDTAWHGPEWDAAVPYERIGVSRHPRGRLYLAIGGAGVMVLEGDAAPRWLLETSGRRQSVGDLGWVGDTLAVRGWNQWMLYAPDGEPRGCRDFHEPGNEFATQVFALRLLPGGVVVGELAPAYPGHTGTELVVALGQDVRRTLYRAPPQPEGINAPFPGEPLGTDTVWAAASNGSGVVVVEQAPPAAAEMQTVRVVRLALDGRTVYRANVRVPVIATSPAWSERRRAERVRGQRTQCCTLHRYSAATAEAFEPYHPPVASVVAGDDGSAWLRASSEGGSVTWIAIGGDGRERGRVVISSRFVATFADAAGLWGVQRTGADEERVLVVTDAPPPRAAPRTVEVAKNSSAEPLPILERCPR